MYVYVYIAEIRKDVSSQYHNALYTGDVAERVKLLRTVGQGMCTCIHLVCSILACLFYAFFWAGGEQTYKHLKVH